MSATLSRAHRLEEHPHGLGGEVDAVTDDLEDRFALTGGAERGGDGPGRAVVQRRHAVEDVRHQRATTAGAELEDAVEGLPCGGRVGVGMPHRRHHAGGGQLVDEVTSTGALGGERHLDDVPRAAWSRAATRAGSGSTRASGS